MSGMLPPPRPTDDASSAMNPTATSIVPIEDMPNESSVYPEPTPIARRHLRQESAEEVERAAHRERIKKMEEKLRDLRQKIGEEEDFETREMQLQREITAFERRLAREC
jgi:TolA-binding protein